MHSQRHILVVGSLNADLVTRVPRLPAPGETVMGSSFAVLPGGKGANQAVAAARLGVAVKMVGRVGADSFGAMLRDELARAGVDVAEIGVDAEQATGTAQITVDADGHNQIAVAPGANATLSARAVEGACGWDGAAMVVLQLEVPLAAVEAAVRSAGRRRLPVVLNAAPMQPLPATLLDQVAWLIVNEVEAAQLSGYGATGVDHARRAAAALQRPGQGVIITLGAAGAVMVWNGATAHRQAPVVCVVDTVAAGDAFVGAFAAALCRGLQPADALALAVAAGSLACTRPGAIPSLPTAAELAVDPVFRDLLT